VQAGSPGHRSTGVADVPSDGAREAPLRIFAPIIGKASDKSVEGIAKTFQGMIRDGKKGADIEAIAKLRGGMTKDEWGETQSGLIRLMGQPVGSEGRDFTAATFMQNFKDMTPKARNIVFGSKGELREAMDEFATVVERLSARDALRNTSNTAANLNIGAIASLIPTALASIPAALAVGGSLIGARQFAKLWTNPKFVKWATGYTKMVNGAAKAGGAPSTAKHAELLRRLAVKEPSISEPAMAIVERLTGAANDNAGMALGVAAEPASTGQELKSENRQ